MKENSGAGRDPFAQRFLEMLTSQANEETCQKCINELEQYISAQLNNVNVMTLFPETAVHLDRCLSCAEAYALLYDSRIAEQNDQLIEPPAIPKPDLSFLPAPSNLSTLLSQHLRTTGNIITLQLTAVLLSLLPPPQQAAPVRSASRQYTTIIHRLTPEQVPELTLPFSLTAYQDAQNETLCLVEINVSPPGISWPDLEGYSVQCQFDDVTLSEKTDDWGTAVIPDIPVNQLPNLTVTIQNP